MSLQQNKDTLEAFLKDLPNIAMLSKTKLGFLTFIDDCHKVISEYDNIYPVECGQLALLAEMWQKGRCDKSAAIEAANHLANKMIKNYEAHQKSPKLFISHSTKDATIVEKLVTMLEQMGVKQPQLFCSSIAGYGIPQGSGDLYSYIRCEMNNDNLFVIMMLSQNYYSSPVCLNEMGAAWVKQSAYQSILLPGFHYSEIKGAVNPRDISFSLDDRENRNLALNDFKDRITSHLGLVPIDHNLWERFRNKFIEEVDQIIFKPV